MHSCKVIVMMMMMIGMMVNSLPANYGNENTKIFLIGEIFVRKKLDSGSIKVLGGQPGDRALGLPGALVGFMPQTTR